MEKTLKQTLQESNVSLFKKDDPWSRDEQDALLKVVQDWLTQQGNTYDQKYAETENEHYVGAKYAIRELLEGLH